MVRRACVLEGVSSEDELSFSIPMGAMRKLLRVSKAVAEAAHDNEYRAEIRDRQPKEWAKAQAKEDAKESVKDSKRVAPGEKIRLEERLGANYQGTAGLSGKEHSATGRKFWQRLLKEKRAETLDIPEWEDR